MERSSMRWTAIKRSRRTRGNTNHLRNERGTTPRCSGASTSDLMPVLAAPYSLYFLQYELAAEVPKILWEDSLGRRWKRSGHENSSASDHTTRHQKTSGTTTIGVVLKTLETLINVTRCLRLTLVAQQAPN